MRIQTFLCPLKRARIALALSRAPLGVICE
jgi:hypothetical protein